MSQKLKIMILGSGTSHGVPMIGCGCEVCTSADPRDRRFRCSAAVSSLDSDNNEISTILIDTPPEFRLAAIANKLQRVDACLITHSHADHILGMDDLRRYNNIIADTISCYGNTDTLKTVRRVFSYAEMPYINPDRPSLEFCEISEPVNIAGFDVEPVELMHGKDEILGYRIGPIAYCTDCSEMPQSSIDKLQNLELLVINALRHRPHPAHMNLAQSLELIERIQPKQAILTHIAHEISHAKTSETLPKNVELAYDGMAIVL